MEVYILHEADAAMPCRIEMTDRVKQVRFILISKGAMPCEIQDHLLTSAVPEHSQINAKLGIYHPDHISVIGPCFDIYQSSDRPLSEPFKSNKIDPP
jgi:hypothetical protein